MRGIPPAAEGADQAYARNELARLNVDSGALVLEQRGFGRQHFKIAGDAAFVALIGDFVRVLCRVDGPLLDGRFLLQNPQAGELIFHIIEGGEDGGFVGGSLGLVAVASLIGKSAALAGVEKEFRCLRP